MRFKKKLGLILYNLVGITVYLIFMYFLFVLLLGVINIVITGLEALVMLILSALGFTTSFFSF